MPTFRALLSVSDKTGLVEFARRLQAAGGELIASGGTARKLAEADIPVIEVADVTGFPEILGGRVKTLHPAIHGGILARRTPQHSEELESHGIAPIDLVVVNLYPFQQTVAQPHVTLATAIEEIDIGGVALLRAAAKNHESVTVVCEPSDYEGVVMAFEHGGSELSYRRQLALKAFLHTSRYDEAISIYLASEIVGSGEAIAAHIQTLKPAASEANAAQTSSTLPDRLRVNLSLIQRNRYGENPHQAGGLYGYVGDEAAFEVLHGKEMSYNNWLDLDGAWQAAQDFPDPTVAIIKHGNPCGLASADTLADAYSKALSSDSVSAFGGIIAVNRPFDLALAQQIGTLFLEVIAAPSYEEDALQLLTAKKNLRLLRATPSASQQAPLSLRSTVCGVLVQEWDRSQEDMNPAHWKVASQRQPSEAQLADLTFAWRTARHVKSNAIVYVKDRATVGVGAGQMSRVDSVMMAGHKAGERAQGAVMSSDAFFPFADGIEAAAKHGIVAVVQPGGSLRDTEVIEAVDRLGLVMVLTGTRHFKH